jgi:hypothetical protein
MESLPPTNDGVRLPQVHYVNSDHLGSAFSAMNVMRQSNQLCDISLEVLDANSSSSSTPSSPNNTTNIRQVRAHKVVLAAASAYFNAMFNSKFNIECQFILVIIITQNCLFKYNISTYYIRFH